MPAQSYSIRNYSREDFEKFVTFCLETQVLEEKEGRAVSALIKRKFKRPNYSPSQDLFSALWKEQIVGFLDMIPEMRIRRIILEGFIHPHHRRWEGLYPSSSAIPEMEMLFFFNFCFYFLLLVDMILNPLMFRRSQTLAFSIHFQPFS